MTKVVEAAKTARNDRAQLVNGFSKLIERLYKAEVSVLRSACDESLRADYRAKLRGHAEGIAFARELIEDLRATGHRIQDKMGSVR